MQGRSRFASPGVDSEPLSTEEVSRRMHNLIRNGRVEEINYDTEKVRVRMGGVLSGWLPWSENEAEDDATWNPPAIGTQVQVLSQGGDLANGVVAARLRQKKWDGPSKDKNHKSRRVGQMIETYDKTNDRLTWTFPEGGSFEIVIGNAKFSLENGKARLEVGGKSVEVTEDGVKMNDGTRKVVFEGSTDTHGDTNAEGADGVFV